MSSRKGKTRAPRGSVQWRSHGGGIELRFTVKGHRHTLHPGLPDNPWGHHQADQLAARIQRDTEYGEFDATLNRYKQVDDAISPTKVPTLGKLWQQYTDHKAPQIEQSTLIRDYGKVAKRIAVFPSQSLEDANLIESHLLKTFSKETARRTLQQIKACCNWAVDRGLIERNPFLTMKVRGSRKGSSKRTQKAFSPEERDVIISTFEKQHPFYLPLVRFAFFTGCRPEEAIALQKKHIKLDRIVFCEAIATDLRLRKNTKTGTRREFPINTQLREILDPLHLEAKSPEDLIFPAPKGGAIDSHNFLNRKWKPLVEKLAAEGQIREYLPFNNARHTFITCLRQKGISPEDLAALVGNSATVIMKNYSATHHALTVPEI